MKKSAIAARHADERLAELEALYAGAPLGLAMFDRDLCFVRINAALAEVNGLSIEDHIGRSAWDVVPELRETSEPALRKVLECGEAVRDIRVAGFTRAQPGVLREWVEQLYPIKDVSGKVIGVGVMCEEITERLQLETKLRELNASLEDLVQARTLALVEANAQLAAELSRQEGLQATLLQSQKLEAIGQLTSGVAHDFNNVIAAITGSYSLLDRRIADEQLLRIVAHGQKAADRGAALVQQLLAFARQKVLEPQVIDLCNLLGDIENLITSSLTPRIALHVNCSPTIGRVRVDPTQLETALINLAVNARDAMPDGGTLTIDVNPLLDSDYRPSDLEAVEAVAIVVTDTGTGMSPEVLARAADPFFTTKAPGKGTGLGLAMVHGFAKQSGGALKIENANPAGVRISLYLPVSQHEVYKDSAPEVVEYAGHGEVLLVDDDPLVRRMTALQLREIGYDVVEADGLAAAMLQLEAHPHLHLLVTDVVMPEGDGTHLAALVRQSRPALPILFITGHADRLNLTGEVILEKPFSYSALAQACVSSISARDAKGRTPDYKITQPESVHPKSSVDDAEQNPTSRELLVELT